MKKITKNVTGLLSVVGLLGLGYEVAYHEASSGLNPRVQKTVERIEKIHLTDSAFAQSFDRGYADLVKRVSPGVVNISTYARPHLPPGYGQGYGGQNPYPGDPFQRFFEDFFGGRVPRGGGRMQPQVPEEDAEDEPNSARKLPPAQPVALGTGFVIDAVEGLILTNNHVIQGAEEVKVQFKEEETDLIPAEVVGRDPELDVALLKVKIKTKLTAIPLGDSDAIDVGEYVLAVGNPLGYGHTVTHGILSAKGRKNPEFRVGRYLQTDASINPGNSGGPLINVRGEVIGINNAIDARGQGIGFAIPINLVKGVLAQLKTKGSVARAYLGVSVADLNPEIAQQLHLDSKLQGVVVSDVSRGAPADKAGIKSYDVITSVNGEKITTASDLTLKISSIPVGTPAKVEVIHNGRTRTVEVLVTERPSANAVPSGRNGNIPNPRSSDLSDFGFRAVELTPQNAQNYGFPVGVIERKTLVVASVEPGRAAANSGLNQGDLILDISGKPVQTLADLERAFKNIHQSVMVRVKRFDAAGNEFTAVVVLNK